jgi:hypothetical protein
MSIRRTCDGCGEVIPAEQAGAIAVQRDANPGALRTPGLAALDHTDWCRRCAAPILAVLGESLVKARQARERRAMAQRAASLDLPEQGTRSVASRFQRKPRHLRLTTE